MVKLSNWEIAHQEYKAFRKRWNNKNIFEHGEKMLESKEWTYKILDGNTYDWYPITEEDYE